MSRKPHSRYSPGIPSPVWSEHNLESHHQKRIKNDKGCFEALLGISGREMTREEYEARSRAVVRAPTIKWEADELSCDGIAYRSKAYLADKDLVLVVLNVERTRFVTCFHKHFKQPHGRDPQLSELPGSLKLKLSRWLDHRESTGGYKNVKRSHGFV